MPSEILFSIFQYLTPSPELVPSGHVLVEEFLAKTRPSHHKPDRDQALQNLRLTCHALNEAATNLLFRIVEVKISKKSLERLEALCRNPSVVKVGMPP
jgi:hypothetical protein